MILRRFDPLSFSLKRVHASMNMSACTLFSEQDKGSNLLRIITGPVLGKQNVQADRKRSIFARGRLVLQLKGFSKVCGD